MDKIRIKLITIEDLIKMINKHYINKFKVYLNNYKNILEINQNIYFIAIWKDIFVDKDNLVIKFESETNKLFNLKFNINEELEFYENFLKLSKLKLNFTYKVYLYLNKFKYYIISINKKRLKLKKYKNLKKLVDNEFFKGNNKFNDNLKEINENKNILSQNTVKEFDIHIIK